MDDRDHISSCEQCGKRIYPGDQYQPGGECDFCPDHAATLSDAVDFWGQDLADQSGNSCWPQQFDSIDEAMDHLERLRQQAIDKGGDSKPLRTA